MQNRLIAVLLVCLSALTPGVRCNADPAAALAAYPKCAQACIFGAFQGGFCAPTDQTCICTNEAFNHNVTVCVKQACTIPESLVTRNASLTNCGAPVRDRAAEIVTVSNIMMVFASLFVIMRFAYKFGVARWHDIGLDDYIVFVTMLSAVPGGVINAHGTTPNGLGKDIWTLTPTQITTVVRFFYVMAWMYFAQAALIKLAILAFYMRIFPAQNVKRLLWGTFIFVCVWGFAFIMTAIFQCWPIHYFWNKWDGLHEGHCADINAISWTHAAMSIALDLWILIIPLWQLRSLHLHWKKKIGVAFMFIVGTFVTIVSILRLQSLVIFGASDNATWEFFDVSLWSTIEISVGIMCVCLPTVRLLLVRLFPVLASGSYGSKGAYYNTSGPRSGLHASGVHEARVASVRRPDTDGEDSPTGIRFQKSYVVQFSDRENDESSLVQMTDLPPPAKAWQADP